MIDFKILEPEELHEVVKIKTAVNNLTNSIKNVLNKLQIGQGFQIPHTEFRKTSKLDVKDEKKMAQASYARTKYAVDEYVRSMKKRQLTCAFTVGVIKDNEGNFVFIQVKRIA